MNLEIPLYTYGFKLPTCEKVIESHEPPFPFRSINLHRKCNLPDDVLTKRYRARNQFIMARQHIQMLLPRCKILSQKSRIISQVWKTRDLIFEVYFKYLASLDTVYLEDYAKRQLPARYSIDSYRKSCASTYGRIHSKKKPEFKIVKFKAKHARTPINFNNSVFGLKVQDVMDVPTRNL